MTNWKTLTEIGEKCLKDLADHEMNHESKYRKGQVCKDKSTDGKYSLIFVCETSCFN